MSYTVKADFTDELIFPKGSCTAAYLTAQTGFGFQRNSNTTVQTSASTVDDTALVDYPTFGCMRSDGLIPSGLVIQHRVRNILTGVPAGQRRMIGGSASWGAASASGLQIYPSESPIVNPAGNSGTNQGGNFHYVPSAGNSVFFDHGADTATRYTYSAWIKPKTNFQSNLINAAVNAFTFYNCGPSNTWKRMVIAKGTASRRYWDPIDGRLWTGGAPAQQRQSYVDLCQIETGDFATEVLGDLGPNIKREPDTLYWPTGTQLLRSDGTVHFRAKFTPKFASTMQVFNCDTGTTTAASTYFFLYSWGTTGQNRAAIKDSDKKLYVKFNNAGETVSTVAMAWSQYDLVEIEVKAGSSVTSVARYRLNGGSWIDLTMGANAQVPAPTGSVGILCDINPTSGNQPEAFPCWLHEVEFLGTTAGVRPTEPNRSTVSVCPGLYEDSSTTANELVLIPSGRAGRAVIRVEKNDHGLTRGPYPEDGDV